MVLNAKELFPDPDTPVITTSLFLGMSTLTSFKLFSLAPLTIIYSLEDIYKNLLDFNCTPKIFEIDFFKQSLNFFSNTSLTSSFEMPT